MLEGDSFHYIALRNPYDPEQRRRRLEAEARIPQDVEGWNGWWRSLSIADRADESAAIALFLGIQADPSGRAGRLAQDLLRKIPDGCKEVAGRSMGVKAALDAIVGQSDRMTQVRHQSWAACFGRALETVSSLEQLVRTTPVLIQGETGTGKELVARALRHSMKGTWNPPGPWHPPSNDAVHLAALPPDLVQSELFGHEKGAFSGAISLRKGVFERCQGGVAFLDEIGELPPQAQVALLRVLQEGVVRRIGASADVPAGPRIVSATHKNLDELVERGAFRLDLLHRLSSVVIELPPLRDRPEDIPLLVDSEIRKIAGLAEQPPLLDSCNEFLRSNSSYEWPGNVRELHAAVRTLALGLRPKLKRRTKREPSISVPSGIANSTWPLTRVERWYCDRVVAEQRTVQLAAKTLGVDRGTLRRRLAESPE